MQERSTIRKTNKQTPREAGEYPSGAPCNVPPASTQESTPTQHGSGVRASPRDPLRNVAKYRSAGWRKDLEHVLKVYYRHTIASFKEAEWAKMKGKFFTHFLSHKEELLDIKENRPIEYIPNIEDLFYTATGLRLNGLRNFFPSPSRMMRGGAHQPNSSMNRWESNHGPTTMWLPWE